MTSTDLIKAKRLAAQLIEAIKPPDIIVIIVTDSSDPDPANTRLLSNLPDLVNVTRYLRETLDDILED